MVKRRQTQNGYTLELGRIPLVWIAVSCISIFVALILFVAFARYTYRINVKGVVYPTLGEVRIKSPNSGVIKGLNKEYGNRVENYEQLLTIDFSNSSKFFGNVKSESLKLFDDIGILNRHFEQINSINTDDKLKNIELEISDLKKSIGLLRAKEKNAKDLLADSKDMYKKILKAYEDNLITIIDLNKAKDKSLDLDSELLSIKQEISDKTSRMKELERQKEQIKLEAVKQEISIQKENLNDNLKFGQLMSSQENILYAPVSGVIYSIVKQNGDFVNVGEEIMTIMSDSKKEIIAFVEPNHIGQIKEGARVSIRYDTYPYQRYGVGYGQIKEIDVVPLSPTQIYNTYGVKLEQPGYKVKINIDEGKFILYPQMTLQALIPVEERSILEWIYSNIFDFSSEIKI